MTTKQQQQVLCFPRAHFADCDRFTPWEAASVIIQSAEATMTWVTRENAESSQELVQPIPCTLVTNEESEYHVFRRIKEGRSDLRNRFSLIIGGHIDQGTTHDSFLALSMSTLTREIDEELRADTRGLEPRPVGLVVDSSSIESSRHIGVVYKVVIAGSVKPKATEEFSMHSRYSRKPSTIRQLSAIRKDFDPWSMIIFSDYIKSSRARDLGKQLSLLPLA